VNTAKGLFSHLVYYYNGGKETDEVVSQFVKISNSLLTLGVKGDPLSRNAGVPLSTADPGEIQVMNRDTGV
jgi:hypothetical protein